MPNIRSKRNAVRERQKLKRASNEDDLAAERRESNKRRRVETQPDGAVGSWFLDVDGERGTGRERDQQKLSDSDQQGHRVGHSHQNREGDGNEHHGSEVDRIIGKDQDKKLGSNQHKHQRSDQHQESEGNYEKHHDKSERDRKTKKEGKSRRKKDDDNEHKNGTKRKRVKAELQDGDNEVEIRIDRNDWEQQQLDDDTGEREGNDDGEGRSGVFGQDWFGMLTDQEQEYFRRTDEMLELDQFQSSQERRLFVSNVFTEAKGKELKLVCSQSCSRLVERLIRLATPRQLRALFSALSGHFPSLVCHRFASHCVEELLVYCVPLVTQELASLPEVEEDDIEDDEQELGGRSAVTMVDKDQVILAERSEAITNQLISIQDLILSMHKELEDRVPDLLTDRFASHTLRVLLMVLSGRPLVSEASIRRLFHGKKAHNVPPALSHSLEASGLAGEAARAVPASFTSTIDKIITHTAANLDGTITRVLAVHPVANPTLQLMLELDLGRRSSGERMAAGAGSSSYGLLELFLPGLPRSLQSPKSDACEFFRTAIFDNIGSRLLEVILSCAPDDIFRLLLHNCLLPSALFYARSEKASYSLTRAIKRFTMDDLTDPSTVALQSTFPHLVERGFFHLIRALFQRAAELGATQEIGKLLTSLHKAYQAPEQMVPALCSLDRPETENTAFAVAFPSTGNHSNDAAKARHYRVAHGTMLVMDLLALVGAPERAIQKSILSLSPPLFSQLAQGAATNKVLIAALSTSRPTGLAQFRRRLVNMMLTLLPELVQLPCCQHLVLAVFHAAEFHVKENIMVLLQTQMQRAPLEPMCLSSIWREVHGNHWRSNYSQWRSWTRGP